MDRRLSRARLAVTAIVVFAALTTGCVKQPYDPLLLEGQDPGVVAEPLAPEEVARVAGEDSNDRGKRRKNKGVQQSVGKKQRASTTQTAAGDGGAESRPGQTTAGDVSAETPVRPASNAGASPSIKPEEFRNVATIADRSADASGDSPDYAEIERVVVDSNGTTARIAVVMAGDLPAALADGEVQGIGIDFYRGDSAESDFQLFADGGYRGWRAFRHTPDGIVPFRGAFAVGGNVLVFEVPWADLGGTKPAQVRTFVDWSQQQTVLTSGGSDFAPNDGRVTVRPAG